MQQPEKDPIHSNHNPLIDEPVPLTPEQEYEQLKARNRRRLVGAGAITLVVGGIFAMIAGGNHEHNNQQPALVAASAPNVSTIAPIPTTASVPNLTETASEVVAAEPLDVQPIGSSVAANNSVPVDSDTLTASQTAILTAGSVPPIKADNNGVNMAPPVVQESHNRVVAERQQREEKRRAIQAKEEQAKAERLAREQAIAERARQASAKAEQQRAAERSLAEQKANAEQRKREQAAKAQPAAAPKASGSGNFAVQAGAFGSKAQADKVRAQVAALGYGASVTTVKTAKGTLYRVQAIGFSSRNEAQSAAAKMTSRGLGGMVVGK